MSEPKLLIVTTSYPPKGGPGVQRNLKLTKYFPHFGFKPYVLTHKEVFFPVVDYDLLSEIPREAEIIRTETLDPKRIAFIFLNKKEKSSTKGNVKIQENSFFYNFYRFLVKWILIPDVGILWLPFAVFSGVKLIRKEKISVIIGSCPGGSSLLISRILSKVTGVPFVCDFRDGWTDYPYHNYPTAIHRKLDAWLESMVIPKADLLIPFGSFLTEKLISRYSISKDKFVEISNGYDPADFKELKVEIIPGGRKKIIHSGNVMEYRQEAFATLVKGIIELPIPFRERIVFEFIGNVNPASIQLVDEAELRDNFIFYGYLPHKEALAKLVSADGSIILLPVGDLAAVTGKIFEYIAIDKTIISICEPESGCGKLTREINSIDTVIHPKDYKKVSRVLQEVVNQGFPQLKLGSRDKYSRKKQTERFAMALHSLLS
jgi:glycosyltransferase involved in cell wall biosynthesis